MIIEKNVATEIVYKLSETIGQNINIMDTNGIIIASSDPSRIGGTHGGALKVLNEHLPELIVENDAQFEGARSGINLPIVFENETVGIIGITGDVSVVLKYGQIIKHMTEILLLESRAKEQRTIEQKARDRFYEEWLIESLEDKNPSEFARLARDLSIDTNASYRILALSVSKDCTPGPDTLTDISRYIRNTIKKELNGSAFRTATHMICIIDEAKSSLLEKVMKDVKSEILYTYSCPIRIGASNEGATLHLSPACNKATLAMERAVNTNSEDVITYYDDFDINYILKNLPEEAKTTYLSKLFKGMAKEDMERALSFASVYLEENGSINSMSERLFVHPNTIKYRISKLTAETGVDIRTCRGAYIFTLACSLK